MCGPKARVFFPKSALWHAFALSCSPEMLGASSPSIAGIYASKRGQAKSNHPPYGYDSVPILVSNGGTRSCDGRANQKELLRLCADSGATGGVLFLR